MSTVIDGDVVRITQHPGQGFFSCCTIHLQRILDYFNQYHQLPRKVDSSQQFLFYKTPQNWNEDIKHEYFAEPTSDPLGQSIIYNDEPVKTTNLPQEEQYSDYRFLNYVPLAPFLQRYFSPSLEIQELTENIQSKYEIDCSHTCVLFYRGNDKATEVSLPSYEQYIEAAQRIQRLQPNIRFLVQSDETEFLDRMAATFPNNHVIFYDEIRHIPKSLTTVDKTFRYQNPVMSKLFVAITFIMSKCEYVICNSGNCSFWLVLFRGHCQQVVQF
jgi:hypothetical protein